MALELTNEFVCEDELGNQYRVFEYTDFVEYREFSGAVVKAAGVKSLFLGNGHSVNMIDAENFKIVQTDKIIRKIG